MVCLRKHIQPAENRDATGLKYKILVWRIQILAHCVTSLAENAPLIHEDSLPGRLEQEELAEV